MEQVTGKYKQTELGFFPEDWKMVSISDLGHVIRGASPRPKGDPRYYGGNIPRLMVEDITRDKHWISPCVDYLTYEGSKLSRLCERGTLILVCSGTPNAVGLPGLLAIEACIHDGILGLVNVNKEISVDYLYYLLLFKQRKLFDAATHGGTFVNLTTDGFREFKLVLPPSRSEQIKIGTALNNADNYITSLVKLIAKKSLIKQGAMQELLKPKVEWMIKRLGEIFSITAGGDLDNDNFSPFNDEKYFYPIYSNSLSDKGLYGYSSIYTSEKDTITVTARGTVGYANSRDHRYTAIGRVLILNPVQKLDCFFMSELINNRIVFANESTGVPQLTAPQISKYEISIPSYEEQTRIGNILSNMDTEIAILEKKLEKARQIKQGMMQQLLTGKIRLV